ncbi:IntraMembrane Protease (IMPAS) family [Caenorhabditis elegans]|nr:IntraMembrane Protease (IMPAS) family [Caenorhabditis elegans]CCD66573.1 IntraMembrane Protease (IMPAS) family [Caenorhabditis elegans]|eukprot:NP_501286.2 IntraMembrane Protease (IMPAS) family [Caenorhabditis elegans]
MRDDVAKIAASASILILSWIVLYHSCRRASTIYFFELDSTTVIFMDQVPAMILPFVFSIVLYFVYLGTKRSANIERDREIAREAEKELKTSSSFNSRKVSREISRRASVSLGDEQAEQQQRIRRLLSDIEEADIENTVRSHRQRMEEEDIAPKYVDDNESGQDTPPPRKLTKSRFVVESAEDGSKIIIPPESSSVTPEVRSRTNSKSTHDLMTTHRGSSSNWISASQRSSRKSSMGGSPDKSQIVWTTGEEGTTAEKCDIYKKLGDIDLFSYSLSALSLLPRSDDGPRVYIQLDLLDIIAELFAVHVPIWASVACIHIILLESFSQHMSFYFYYHEESMMYASLLVSLSFGLYHECSGNWISNDILAFASIYVVCSRIQAVSYQTAIIFVIGMSLFDLFFLYVVDLLSTVVKENRSPLMILVPRDTKGNKQSLAALDIMVPGVFLNVVLKYSSMYDTNLFAITFAAVFASLVFSVFFSIWRSKTTPAMVLPAISAIIFSIGFANHTDDLWKFMIKH